MEVLTTTERPTLNLSGRKWRIGTGTFAIAAILWIASNVFVTAVVRVAKWEGIATYRRMLDLCRWDCSWYASIVEPGYSAVPLRASGEANWVFNPLFPMTAYPLHKWFKLTVPGSLVLAGKLECLLAIYAFLLMLSEEAVTITDRYRAGALVAFNPYLIYAHAGYAEPLYFALIALGFYFLRRRQWLLAGALGGLASGTRVVGALFASSYFVAWMREEGWRARLRKLDLKGVIGLLLCPLGALLFMLYLYHLMGDALALQHGHVAWGRGVGNPLHIFWNCLTQSRWPRVWAVMMLAGWLFSAWLFRLRQPELGLYLALVLLPAALSPMSGYWGVARYIWWQPPFLYAIYRILRRSEAGWTVYLVFSAGMAAFMVIEWFTGHNFVV